VKVTVASWVHRTIRRQEAFVDRRDDASIAAAYAGLGEDVVGVYRNPAGAVPAEIVVTERGLVLRDGAAVTRFTFADVTAVHGPAKGADGRIRLDLRDGTSVDLTIAGKQGRFEDVFEFLRFLRRVTDDFWTGKHDVE
jgi:hypothetical protein